MDDVVPLAQALFAKLSAIRNFCLTHSDVPTQVVGPDGKRSGSSGTEDEDLAVVTDAVDNGKGSKSPTPVANLGEVAGPRLPNSATFGKGEANIVCKYS